MESLKNQNMEINLASVTKEFHGWKGNKYPEWQIREAFDKISTNMPISLQ
jgi:hypothetical protein